MTTRNDFVKYNSLERKLAAEIEEAKKAANLQEMPDEVWDDPKRRMEWLAADKVQWNFNTGRLARLRRLYDKCFPKKEWVIVELENFFEEEEGPLY